MLKRRVRPFLVGALELSGVLPALRRRRDDGRAVILTYHSVSDPTKENEIYRSPDIATSPALFARQMSYLREHYSVVPLAELVDCLRSGRGFPAKAVAITFDDGYKDNHDVALPILKRFGFPATVFVTTDAIGDGWAFWPARVRAILLKSARSRFEVGGLGAIGLDGPEDRTTAIRRITRFLKRLGTSERRAALARLLEDSGLEGPAAGADGWMMTWDEVRAMSAAGVEFGSHTRSHPILTTLGDEEVVQEISDSRRRIEEEIGKPVLDLAYPNGSDAQNFDDRVSALVARSGFRSASSSRTGPIHLGCDRFQLSRVSISERHKLDGLALALERDRVPSPLGGERGRR